MIEKMMFVNLTGPIQDIDRIASQYLSHYDIHLENPLTAVPDGQKLLPITEVNPYRDRLSRLQPYAEKISVNPAADEKSADPSLEEIDALLEELSSLSSEPEPEDAPGSEPYDREVLIRERERLSHFASLDFDLKTILDFRHIKVHFGRLPGEAFDRWDKHIKADEPMIFRQTDQDRNFIWGAFCFPETESKRMEALLISLRFENILLKASCPGTPADLLSEIDKKLQELEKPVKSSDREALLEEKRAAIAASCRVLASLSDDFDIRKKAAQTILDGNAYFILCGWMTKKDARELVHQLHDEKATLSVISKDSPGDAFTPPTKLRNPGIFKPYEMYIRMYGLPDYHEFDPTIFVALTYSLLFGAMYGDLGQGLCLLFGGLLLYRLKHINLAGIIAMAGGFSAFFGLMFGSVFGFENLIPAFWLRPMKAMTTLPFIGRLNTVFVYAVSLGMGLIILTMIFHIILAVKRQDKGEGLLGTNGLAGLIFYGTIVLMLVFYFSGHTLTGTAIFVSLIVISVILMFLKEPLTHLIEKKKGPLIEGSPGMFFVQSFFELFEVMLSYFSNTLSFVRVGAFAVSHAAMMQVVMMLAGAENGSPNLAVVILGNIFVMGLEGLIVGIQVLRLEYYEMFSRFYSGNGHPFISFFKEKAQ